MSAAGIRTVLISDCASRGRPPGAAIGGPGRRPRYDRASEPESGYLGSSNLLVRYINQRRLESSRPHLSPRRAARLMLTRPDRLADGEAETLTRIEAACPEMTALAALIRSFAEMLAPAGETRPGSSDGSPVPARLTCPTCTPSPEASISTSRPPRRHSPCRITTAGPTESTPERPR